MAGHLGFLIAGGAMAPVGVVLMLESNLFALLSPIEELDRFMRMMGFGFFIAGLCVTIIGSILLIIGFHKYRNRDSKLLYS